MIIIKAGKSHTTEVIRLVSRLLSELNGEPCEVDPKKATTFIEQASDSHRYAVFLALDDQDQAVGIINTGEAGAVYTEGSFGVILEFYVEPAYRSHGLGRQLLERVKRRALEMGWTRLEVGAPSYPEWSRTKAFYQREGFTEVGPKLKWHAED
ncbi:MAG: GNAT family N-acetyltransferase [Candidatus Marinimicrobia bacterium]|nr:GNAT family N-acetyltransferase [Candidatus Neomarinimicrobiota bacterium]MCF7903939.1 GNAT family N-acetyltransferase [Candidatus Neomarinimicrobiota bacterium]